MRQNMVIVLLSVCCTLLAVNLYVSRGTGSFGRGDSPDALLREAFGQAAAVPTGQIAMATVQGTSNDAWVYLYDVTSQRLAVYRTQNRGIELKGVRQLTWDLKIEELNAQLANRNLTTSQVRSALEGKEGK